MKKTYEEIINTFDYSLDVADCASMIKVLDDDLKKSEVIEFLHQQFYEELHFAFIKLKANFTSSEAARRLKYFRELLSDD